MNRNKFETMFKNADLMGIKECFKPTERRFSRGDNITISSSDNNNIGIIMSGTVYLTTINCDEQRRIIDYYTPGDVIGPELPPKSENKVFYYFAKTDCRLEFIKYGKLINPCNKVCIKHISLIDEMIKKENEKKIMHLDILMQKSVRDKLITYLEYLADNKGTAKFTVPIPFIDLADYLAVDRSAMMRELSKMNDDNIIISDKRKITLVKELKK